MRKDQCGDEDICGKRRYGIKGGEVGVENVPTFPRMWECWGNVKKVRKTV